MDSIKLGGQPGEEAQCFANSSDDMALAQIVSGDVGSAQKHEALQGRVSRHGLVPNRYEESAI